MIADRSLIFWSIFLSLVVAVMMLLGYWVIRVFSFMGLFVYGFMGSILNVGQ